jgi:NADPH:quinone reductase-like Zn-dependent oxidoreductase
LIYGGSTSVGLFALQLAKAMGYKVVTTASPHSFDLVKQYGADEVVDYHDGKAASEKIKEITGGGVKLGLDCIAEGGSFDICLDAFKAGEGQLNLVLPASPEIEKKRPDIKKPFTLMYSLLGNVRRPVILLPVGQC